jgi:hypothetical protein
MFTFLLREVNIIMHVRLIKIHKLIAATARWVKMFQVLDYNNGLSEIKNILPQS